MTTGPTLLTPLGPVQCSTIDALDVHRIGYAPNPWHWTAWEYAGVGGRFLGRWDDLNAVWRVLYAGSSALACYLEVLAPFRPDPALASEMAEIVVDDEDELLYPTAATGELSISWCEPRRLCSAQMSGCFALPAHHETLPTLRQQFLQLAHRCGCTDLDAAAIRNTNAN